MKTKTTPHGSPWFHFGPRLKAIINFYNTPHRTIALQCSCCESLVSRWFAGDRHPTPEQLAALSSLYNLTPEQLLGSESATLKSTLKLRKHKLPPLESLPQNLGQPELPTTLKLT